MFILIFYEERQSLMTMVLLKHFHSLLLYLQVIDPCMCKSEHVWLLAACCLPLKDVPLILSKSNTQQCHFSGNPSISCLKVVQLPLQAVGPLKKGLLMLSVTTYFQWVTTTNERLVVVPKIGISFIRSLYYYDLEDMDMSIYRVCHAKSPKASKGIVF